MMAETCRILVTGSRTWTDWRTISEALIQARRDLNPDRVPVLVQGCARGADSLAAQAARKLGWEVEDHPADWGAECRGSCPARNHRIAGRTGETYCPAAGHYRNAEMVALGADICLAFIRNRSEGATSCANLAEKAGIPVRRFTA